MDWGAFFDRTRKAAGVESFAKLAPLLGVTDGAISHYRVGRSVPQVWVVADCLRIQGHPEPEKAAVEIMRLAARTSPERTFWKRLLATTALLAVMIFPALPSYAASLSDAENKVFSAEVGLQEECALCEIMSGVVFEAPSLAEPCRARSRPFEQRGTP